MYVIAVSFVAFAALLCYQWTFGPGDPQGLEASFTAGTMVVQGVLPDSQVERAGLQPGDRVVAVDGQAPHTVHDWAMVAANMEVGRPRRWTVARGGRTLEVEVTQGRGDWREGIPDMTTALLALLIGFFVAFRRPYDPVARMGAWFIVTSAIGFGLPGGWAATWRHMPAVVGALVWIPQVSRFVVEAILLSFFALFPRRLFHSRWPWVVVWTPVLVTVPWRVWAVYAVVYRPGHFAGLPNWVFQATFVRTVLYLAAGGLALFMNYRRLSDRNEKRRVRVVVAGTAVSLIAAIALLPIVHSVGFTLRGWVTVYSAITLLLILVCPLSFAYAILRHRVLDIQVIIRQGLQYALARGAVLGLVPALGVILVADLAVHSSQPLASILRARGWIYAALGVLAFVAYARRKQWLDALDRRFFRERYDAQRVLREVVEEVREARGFEPVAPRVVARIEAALHPEFVALMVRQPRETTYRNLASAPSGHAPPPLPAEGKLLQLVRVLGKPLEISLAESGWLKQQLPHSETDFVRQARIDLLVPILITPGRTEALLALGIKRSEEPYTKEDQGLLEAIASSLALLLERPAVAPAEVSEAFEECPQCGACYDTGTAHCTGEGASLVATRLPRTLAGRYRLERRRGRGGMGAVYEATDSALERQVAVKVIREDLAGSQEAADRFRREARAAASFTHPNVVTVYDFGVDADTRAFLVMELLEGATLREQLKRQKRLDAPRVVEILRGVCAAVDAAHRRQLVHRDLKPENIFLARAEESEVVKVLDFGIAKFVPVVTLTVADITQATADTGGGFLLGTIPYMSPEQLRGESLEAGWDLWALAVVAYEMLTGAQPFSGATVGDCHRRVLAGQLTPLAQYLPESPSGWQEFFAQAFAMDRRARPSSAQVFFSGLERALA